MLFPISSRGRLPGLPAGGALHKVWGPPLVLLLMPPDRFLVKPGGQVDGDEALEFYAKHTAQIEVKAGYTWDPGSRLGPPQWVPWAGAGVRSLV